MDLEGGEDPTTVPPLPPYTCMAITFTYLVIISYNHHKNIQNHSQWPTCMISFFPFFGSLSHGSEQAHGALLLAGGGQSEVGMERNLFKSLPHVILCKCTKCNVIWLSGY
ncbi:hypothetical protein TNCT_578421 [Trichonephila clavata]|uniref:Uncharacterized protein n=1 Tax=Trichonephila clavata TaxID=2740835 RepID=A0A8X6JAL9_TRICU|nr:hypothetical protein TNCT_578421 [Trichonephila clavata]